jgi:hypothetical protein
MTFIAGNRLAYTKLLKLRPDQALDAQVVALGQGRTIGRLNALGKDRI